MDTSDTLPIEKIKVTIKRGDEEAGDSSVLLLFPTLKTEIALSDSSVEDIKKLFDAAFEYIVSKKSLVAFEIEDTENDLFSHVSQDIIDQLNAEIKESERDFVEIWNLVKKA